MVVGILKVFSRLTKKFCDCTPTPSTPEVQPLPYAMCPSPSSVPLTCPGQNALHLQSGAVHCCSPVWPVCPLASSSAPKGHSSCGGRHGTPDHPSLQAERGHSQPGGHLVSRAGWLRPQPYSHLPRKRRDQEREPATPPPCRACFLPVSKTMIHHSPCT